MMWKEIVKEVDEAFSYYGDSMSTESAKRVTRALVARLKARITPPETRVVFVEPEPEAQVCNRDEIWEHI